MSYTKIPQESYDKAKGQLRLSLHGVFEPFNQYGMGIYITPAIEEVLQLCEQFGRRVRGDDIPIMLRRK